jgi:hypothetical protein
MVQRNSKGILSLTLTAMVAACGGSGGSGSSTTRATTGFSGTVVSSDVASDSGFATRVASRDAVDIDTIHSLILTVTQIEMHHGGGEGGDENGSWITIYDDPDGMDVDLKTLDGSTSIVDTVDIPSGRYTKIVIHYENPRLTLVGDEETEIDNIHVTANSRMFISQSFDLEPGGATLIFIDFNSAHLTFNPSQSRYTLTPQLRMILNLESANVVLHDRTITDKVDESKMIRLDDTIDVFGMEGTEYRREVEPATDTLRSHESGPTELIEFLDLMLGDVVDVESVVHQDGSVVADAVEVQLPVE